MGLDLGLMVFFGCLSVFVLVGMNGRRLLMAADFQAVTKFNTLKIILLSSLQSLKQH